MSEFAINERSSAKYTATLKDQSGAVVPGSVLETFTISIIDVATGAVLNGWNAKNALNANGCTIDESGNLVWYLSPADNAVVHAAAANELHAAIFKGVWSSGTRGCTHRVNLRITNHPTVT